MRSAKWLGTCVFGVLVLATPARAQKDADTLRVVWWDQIVNVNPYYNLLRAGLTVTHQAFDGLVYRDPETFAIKPLLAASWRSIDDTTLELRLRRGVKFHDGSDFSADDVVYTINSVLNDKQVSVPNNYAWMSGAEKVDDYTVRIKLKRVFPAAIEYLSMVLPIMPRAYRERVGSDAYDKEPLGAGPYRITRVDGVNEIDLERFEGYYAGSPKGRPPIRHVVIHEVVDATTAQNEIIGNRADWTVNVPPDNVDQLGALPFLQATRVETMRVNYLTFDAAGRTGADNPLTRQKVRQAFAYAIDRAAIARTLQPGSRAIDTPCYPTQFGCDAAVAVHYPYDPAKARALLAEAGYKDGFSTEMVSYMQPQYEGAVQGYLKAVGIDLKVTHLQIEAAIKRNIDGTVPVYFNNWGSYSINDASAFLPQLCSAAVEGWSGSDDIRDATLKQLVQAGGASTDADQRRRNYSAAIKLITEQGYILPIMTGMATYVARKEVNFKAYADELPRFYLMNWK